MLSQEAAQRNQPAGLGWQDAALLAAMCASLISTCIWTSARKLMWTDEVFSWQTISTSSLRQLLHVLYRGADSSMPLYFTLAWLWRHVFGAGPLSLRLMTSLCVCGAMVLVWITLRQVHSMRATAFGVLAVWGTSRLVLYQNSEARFYGLFLLLTALATFLYVKTASTERVGLGLFAATLLTHAGMVLTHFFGAIYSGIILVALGMFDVSRRRFRWAAYSPIVLSWLVILPEIGAIRNASEIAVPHHWVAVPAAFDVLNAYDFGMDISAVLIALMLVIVLETRDQAVPRSPSPLQRALFLVALGFLAVPGLLAVFSHGQISFFVPRYFLPSVIGFAILLTQAVDRVVSPAKLNRWGMTLWGLIFASLLLCPMARVHHQEHQAIDPALARLAGTATPVVMEDFFDFLTFRYYAPNQPYFFVLDWPVALENRSPYEATEDFKLMRNWRAVGFWSDHIVDAPDFLCTDRAFLVFDTPLYQWYEQRIEGNPDFEATLLGSAKGIRGTNRIWRVQRKTTANCSSGLP